jgi:hypothetical protein
MRWILCELAKTTCYGAETEVQPALILTVTSLRDMPARHLLVTTLDSFPTPLELLLNLVERRGALKLASAQCRKPTKMRKLMNGEIS